MDIGILQCIEVEREQPIEQIAAIAPCVKLLSHFLIDAHLCCQVFPVRTHELAQGSKVVGEFLGVILKVYFHAASLAENALVPVFPDGLGILDAVLQKEETAAGEEQRIVVVDAAHGGVSLVVKILLPFSAVEYLGVPDAVALLAFRQASCDSLDTAYVVHSEVGLKVGQRQLHFHRRVVLAAAHLLQLGHRPPPHLVGHFVGFVKCALELPQRFHHALQLTRCAEPSLHVMAAAIVIDTFVAAKCALAHGDINSLARAGEESDGIEEHLRTVSNERIAHGVARQELLAERAVVGDVEHQHRVVLIEYVIVVARHRREAELLGIIVLDASLDGDGVCLEPVGGHRPRVCLNDFLHCRRVHYFYLVVDE